MENENKTFLNSVNKEKVNSLLTSITNEVEFFNTTCLKIISQYSFSLDEVMKKVYSSCVVVKDPPLADLEHYYLELSNSIYFMISELETLGIHADMSKANAKEVYSNAYLNNQIKSAAVDKKNKATVAECQAVAELAAQYESAIGNIYERAYKVLKGKLDSAKDMCDTLRRVIATKTEEMKLSNSPEYDSGVNLGVVYRKG